MAVKNRFNDSSNKSKKSLLSTKLAGVILAATVATSSIAIYNKVQEVKKPRENNKELVCSKKASIAFQKTVTPTSHSKSAKSYTTSLKGIDVIMDHEGFMDHAYTDVNKKAIGFGHNIVKGEKFPKTISLAQAKKLLMKDLKIHEAAVKQAVKVKITQEHFDAMVSFSYNVGPENFRTSTMLKQLNAGNFESAGKEFDNWVFITGKKGVCKKSEGLQDRRNAEQALFVKGNKKAKQFI